MLNPAKLQAGDLRTRVVIQAPTSDLNELGASVKGWATWRQVWALVEPLTGTEGVMAQQTHALATYRVTIRYMTGVNVTMRVQLNGGELLQISAAIDPDHRRAWLQLTCTEDKSRSS